MTALSKLAVEIIVDRGYMKIYRLWYSNLVKASQCSVVQIETNVVVPILEACANYASDFNEFSPAIKAKAKSLIMNYHPKPLTPVLVKTLDFTIPNVISISDLIKK